MTPRGEAYYRGVPFKPYDLVREALMVFGLVALLVTALAVVFQSPDDPALRAEDVARRQPIAYLETAAGLLAGRSGLQHYGPPYTADAAGAQEVLGVAPARLFGVTIPIHARQLVLGPLARAAILDPALAAPLAQYRRATPAARSAWATAYLAALAQATVVNGEVRLPPGAYGPVEPMMAGMLALGRAGLLEGALDGGRRVPYTLDFTRALLFFQGPVDHAVARRLDMLGSQWGISHETGPYPGAWWLWPYTFLYQVPPMSRSPNGDLQVGLIMTAIFLLLLFVPFVPVVNRLPQRLGAHRVIWRRWYRRQPSA
ncbi:MAG TPA: hypothetical protein VNE16_03880 [Vicinamibacterales bacterium]|nr:hypothetical protein [Vicinamibacterales bacterium]